MMDDSFTETTEREPAEQIAGRFVGMAVFLVGIVLLVLSFVLAFRAFQDPNMIIPPGSLSGPALPPASVYLAVLLRLILLFAMGYIGSLIAARGAQLFFTARKGARRAVSSD